MNRLPSRVELRVALRGVWLMVICGCQPNGEPLSGPDAGVAVTPEEQSWSDQLVEVRAGRTRILSLAGPVPDHSLSDLEEGCGGLEELRLADEQLSDEALASLKKLTSLRHLVLFAPVSDAGIEQIAGCPSLEILNLPHGTFTDAGLARLKSLPLLIQLRFRSPNVTDAGMEEIVGMTNLRRLHLIDVPITDEGLKPLEGMTLLESFYIDGGKCSEEGLRRLLNARPHLHMHVDQLHLPGDPADDHSP